MEKIIRKFLSKCEKDNKKRFDLRSLEKFIVDSYKGHRIYMTNGGYFKLYDEINSLKEGNYIRQIESSSYNGLNPPLKTRWQIISKEDICGWNKSKMLQFSDLLDFTYYENNPKYQSNLEWEYIENIYKFLKSREERQWASIEERSLELFYDEKFLKNTRKSYRGKLGLLKRLRLTNEDLKMKKYGEMFIYWNKGVEEIKKIIILENHSTFFTYKRVAEVKEDILGFQADILIYGGGKKIESSFSFLEEIADISNVEVLYFGDVDSEGFGIYTRLRKRYPEIDIKLQHQAYRHLISRCDREYPLGGQEKNSIYLDCFIEEMKDYLDDKSLGNLRYIWDNNFRIPQELLNYEYLLKVK